MHMSKPWQVVMGGMILAIVAGHLVAQPLSPTTDEYQKLIAEKSPALVTVKFLLKLKMGSRESETDSEVTGVMIDPKGVLLCSNTQLGGMAGMYRKLMGAASKNISSKPTDIKVLIGDDTTGLEADFLARDSELDLAWIQIKNPGDRKFAFLDLTQSTSAKVGDRLLALRRMDKYFNRSMVVSEGRVGGITKKPRDLYVPSGDLSTSWGMPVFNGELQLIGILTVQFPDEEDGSSVTNIMSRMSSFQDMGSLILPAADVVKATERAKTAPKEADDESTTTKPVEEDETKATADETESE